MILFKLIDAVNPTIPYVLELKFSDVNEFHDWAENNKEYDRFLDKMKSGNSAWNYFDSGLDVNNIGFISFTSNEIRDFDTAIHQWGQFFWRLNKLYNKTALQELIDEFEHIKKTKCRTLSEIIFFDGVLSIIEAKYLDKEKAQIAEAYESGSVYFMMNPDKEVTNGDGLDYYEDTYTKP